MATSSSTTRMVRPAASSFGGSSVPAKPVEGDPQDLVLAPQRFDGSGLGVAVAEHLQHDLCAVDLADGAVDVGVAPRVEQLGVLVTF